MSDVLQRVRDANPFVDFDDLDLAEFEMALAAIEDRWEFGHEPPRIPATRPGWMRPVLVAAGAALLVTLAIAAPILILQGEEHSVTDTTVPSVTTTTQVVTTTLPVATTTPTTIPPAVPAAPAMTWTRVPDDPVFENGWIKAVAVGDEGIVAAGGSGGSDRGWPADAAIWHSADGFTWQAIDEASLIGDPDAGGLWGATVWGLATGALGIVAGGHHGTSAAIWTSSNGVEWTRTLDEPYSGVLGVTAGGPGWVAVGEVDMDGGIWISVDGLDWVRVEDDDLLAGDRVDATIYDVATWSGGLIAVGALGVEGGTGDREERGAIWLSKDGYEWTELTDESFRETRVFEGVSVDPSKGTVFAFSSPGGIWKSDDGATWEIDRCEGSWVCPPPSAGVAWDGDRAVAGGPDMALSLWTSGDSGTTWLRVDSDDPAFDGYSPGVDDVTRFGDRFVVVGFAGEYMEDVGAIWIGTWDD